MYVSSLNLSLFLALVNTRMLTLVVVDSSFKLKTSSTKWQSLWRVEQTKSKIVLPLQDDMIHTSVEIICSDAWLFCLLICSPPSLLHSPNTTPEYVVSLCWCALTLKLSTSIGIWQSAVSRNLHSLLCNCLVVNSFPSFVFDWLWILSVSLPFLFNGWLFLLIVGSK